MKESEYQHKVKRRLEQIYSGEEVKVQWRPFLGNGRDMYAPRVDVAVGPFAIQERYETRYADLLEKTRSFVERLIEKHNQNVEAEDRTDFYTSARFNRNARCLFCIEVEQTGGRKHCLGDLVNASALGRIGLLIARSEESFRIFVRQRVYLRHLRNLEKNTFNTTNALVLKEEQFNECLTDALRSGQPTK